MTGHRSSPASCPCNVIPDEILTDHPDRFRALLVESGNPVHSLADSQRMREALDALDFVVVIDVALTETARAGRLRAARGVAVREVGVHVLQPRVPATTTSTCARRSSSRWRARCPSTRSTRAVPRARRLHRRRPRAAPRGRRRRRGQYADALFTFMAEHPTRASCCRSSCTRRSARRCDARRRRRGRRGRGVGARADGAGFWDASIRRAGFGDPTGRRARRRAVRRDPRQPVRGDLLGRRLRRDDAPPADARRQGQPRRPDAPRRVRRARRRAAPVGADDAFPLVLSAGERRSSTANTIYRDPAWRKKDQQGALRISPATPRRSGSSRATGRGSPPSAARR